MSSVLALVDAPEDLCDTASRVALPPRPLNSTFNAILSAAAEDRSFACTHLM